MQTTRQKLAQEQENLTDLKGKYKNLEETSQVLETKLKQAQADLEEKAEVISTLEDTRTKIEEELKTQISNQQIKIEEIEGKLKLTFVDKILFDSGRTNINEKGQEALIDFAEAIKEDKDHKILVEGHTDNVGLSPLLRAKYPSNWELSTARASSVVRFLQEKCGIEPEKLTAVGFSYFKPIASNDNDEGRGQNRRIEIIMTRAN
jgi:chemotaxis protein MotB